MHYINGMLDSVERAFAKAGTTVILRFKPRRGNSADISVTFIKLGSRFLEPIFGFGPASYASLHHNGLYNDLAVVFAQRRVLLVSGWLLELAEAVRVARANVGHTHIRRIRQPTL